MYVISYKPFVSPLLNSLEIINDWSASQIIIILMVFLNPDKTYVGQWERDILGYI